MIKSSRKTLYKHPTYMLEDMALVSLPDAVNVGLCGKACYGKSENVGN